jgi:hypothetical protein
MRSIEFWEQTGDPTKKNEQAILKGTCLNDTILLGDHFTVGIDAEGLEFAVCLEVVELRFYGHLVEEIERSYGFHLVVKGHGLDLLSPAIKLYGVGAAKAIP